MTIPTLTFRSEGPGVFVDLLQLVLSKLLVQANSGGGKSWAIRFLLEQTHGRIQHIVIDREGEFATLREQFPYLLVGKEGEIAADVRTAALLPRKLLELGVSAIIDLSDMSVPQQREYVAKFIGTMNDLPRELWRDALVVVDEAHIFAPETGKVHGPIASKEALSMAGATWRKRGWGLVLATQRLAKLDKDTASECLNKMIGRTSEDDVKRAREELRLDVERAQGLRSLKPGTFWVYGPAIAEDALLVRTGDVVTHPPKRGKLREPAPPTPEAIQSIMGALADLPQEAEAEARTVDDLRKRNAELARRVRDLEQGGAERTTEVPVADPAAIEAALGEYAGIIETRHAAAMRELRERVLAVVGAATDALAVELERIPDPPPIVTPSDAALLAARPTVGGAGHMPVVYAGGTRAGKTEAMRREVARAEAAGQRVTMISPTSGDAVPVSGPQRRMLQALASFRALGIGVLWRSHLAVFSDQSPTSSGFEKNLSTLRTRGLVDYPVTGSVALTAAGARVAGHQAPPASLAELHAAWLAKLSGPQGRMLGELTRRYPRAMARADLAERTTQSLTSSGFEKNLSTLRSLGLIDYPDRETAVATQLLFPEGLK